ncbi:MAG: hypothetical protein AAF960_26545 [Bacteroidota bacterium]
MKIVENIEDISWELETNRMLRIANEAVQKAKSENRKFGLPEVFCKNGKIYYLLPDGEITTQKPTILK